MKTTFHFHQRDSNGRDDPGGYTVSRSAKLPDGDFRITEYRWPRAVLWFVDADKFTADERQAAYAAFLTQHGGRTER